FARTGGFPRRLRRPGEGPLHPRQPGGRHRAARGPHRPARCELLHLPRRLARHGGVEGAEGARDHGPRRVAPFPPQIRARLERDEIGTKRRSRWVMGIAASAAPRPVGIVPQSLPTPEVGRNPFDTPPPFCLPRREGAEGCAARCSTTSPSIAAPSAWPSRRSGGLPSTTASWSAVFFLMVRRPPRRPSGCAPSWPGRTRPPATAPPPRRRR